MASRTDALTRGSVGDLELGFGLEGESAAEAGDDFGLGDGGSLGFCGQASGEEETERERYLKDRDPARTGAGCIRTRRVIFYLGIPGAQR